MVNGWYLIEVDYKETKRVIWEVVNNQVVEEGVEHEDLGIQGFDCILFDENRESHTSIENNY